MGVDAEHARMLARSFDLAADSYERTRPDYPAAILDPLPIPANATVLDLGAGTGKLTRVLTRRYAHVIAVEPLDGMRAILERVVPEAEAIAGRAEAIPLPDASVDAVFAAQAFHWFTNADAVREIARVLRPGRPFCVVWNEGDESRPSPFPAPYWEYLEELRAERGLPDGPRFAEVLAQGPFGPVNEHTIAHDHVLDREGLLDNARSVSWIASRAADDRDRVLARLAELLPDGSYSIPNLATVLWAARTTDAELRRADERRRSRSIYRPPWRVDVVRRDGVHGPLAGAAIARTVGAALDACRAPAPGSVTVVLSDDEELADLNAAHLGHEGPTDVLSFPMLEPEAFDRSQKARPKRATQARRRSRTHIGDIAISVERAVQQAEQGQGGQTGDVRWSPADEMRLLVTHGTLHLCGWDHAEPDEEAAMRALERKLLDRR